MINLAVIGVDLVKGMAETQLVRNMFKPLFDDHLATVYNLRNRKIECITFENQNNEKPINLFRFLLQRSLSKKKILYVYGYPDLKNILTILQFKLKGYKTIFHLTEDLRYQNKTYSFKGKINIMTALFFIRFINLLSKGCIVISEHIENRIRQLSGKKYPILNLPISIDIEKITKQKPENLIKSNSSISFFYGGSFAPKDGLDIVINGFEKLVEENNNVELIITGKGVKDDEKIVKIIIKNSQAKENIRFKGYMPYENYLEELWNADALLMTRVDTVYANAGFPFKLGEYLATGKTVIATKLRSMDKYLINFHNSILVDPGNADSFLSAFRYVVDNKKQLSDIGIEAKKTACKYFDNREHAKILYNFLEINFS